MSINKATIPVIQRQVREAGAAAQQQLIESKEIQDQIAGQFRMNLRLRYGGFYAETGWSEPQVYTFENAMMEKFWTMSDVVMATRKVGSSDQETAELRRQQLADAEDKLRLALGDESYRDYIEYDITADARSYIEALAGKVFYNEALSPSQAAQLAALVTSNATAKRPDEWLRNQVLLGENAVSWTDFDWEAVAVGPELSSRPLNSPRCARSPPMRNCVRKLRGA